MSSFAPLAVVTSDVQATVGALQKRLGFESFKIWNHKGSSIFGATFRGKPEDWKMKQCHSHAARRCHATCEN